jgi:archaellum biogenesis protein FlaJ (TadC family)
MAVEKYIAAASLGLFVMFVGEIISLYVFMIDIPQSNDPFSLLGEFEADPKIYQFISIGVAPASIMAVISFILTKRHGSKPIGIMIVVGGVILLLGMVYANSLVSKIEAQYLTDGVSFIPPLIMVVSIPVMVIGALLLRVKKPKKKKDYV